MALVPRLRAALQRAVQVDRRRLVLAGRRSQQVLVLAGLTGALTGLVVAGFERLAAEVVFAAVLDLPLWAMAAAPLVGLVLARASLRWLAGGASPATSDEYIRSFHERGRAMDTRPYPGRMAAAVAALGLGGSMGYEGPAIYSGASIGAWLQQRLPRQLVGEDPKVLLVAGAAAGVAAIFKAPVTGLVFALEVPYHDDLARRMILPAAIAAATSYVAFVALIGTAPLFPVAGQPQLELRDLAGAAVVGLIAGALARLFAFVIATAKASAERIGPWRRAVAAGVLLAGLFALGRLVAGANLALGAGYDTLRWAADPDNTVLVLVAACALRLAGGTVTVAGGGVGGLFIPLVVQGFLVGQVTGELIPVDNPTLFPVVGIAAFLGAGYGVPLAAVVFVAEATGRPGFVVPGLIAAVIAQLVSGRRSVSPYQASRRVGHLEERLGLPVASVVDTEVRTVPPDATLDELFWHHLVGTRQRTAMVVDGNRYLGKIGLAELSAVPREDWASETVADHMRTDLPVVRPGWPIADAVAAMTRHQVDRLAVCDDGDGIDSFIGVISEQDVVDLDEILEATEG